MGQPRVAPSMAVVRELPFPKPDFGSLIRRTRSKVLVLYSGWGNPPIVVGTGCTCVGDRTIILIYLLLLETWLVEMAQIRLVLCGCLRRNLKVDSERFEGESRDKES